VQSISHFERHSKTGVLKLRPIVPPGMSICMEEVTALNGHPMT
jgi:hypothetical protein